MAKPIPFILLFCFTITNSLRAQWSELGGPNALSANNSINTICTDKYGNIYAAGFFDDTSGQYYVAKWDGNSWSNIGSPNGNYQSEDILGLCSDTFGNIYVSGLFTDSLGYEYVGKWNGSSWTKLLGLNAVPGGFGPGGILTICTDPTGNVYAAGGFINADTSFYVAQWNGNGWSELGGLNALAAKEYIQFICSDASGNIYAAGALTDNQDSLYVAKWNGSNWSKLTGIYASGGEEVYSICTDSKNNLYAATAYIVDFYIAEWNGSNWAPLGTGTNSLKARDDIIAICADGAGNVYASAPVANWGNNYYVAKWNGNNWSELGPLNQPGFNGWIRSIVADRLGNIYMAGSFTDSSGKYYVAKYSTVTGIQEFPKENSASIFPNPNNGILTIKTTDTRYSSFAVYDINGRLMAQEHIDNTLTKQFDMSTLAVGLYFLELKSESGDIEVMKVIKEN